MEKTQNKTNIKRRLSRFRKYLIPASGAVAVGAVALVVGLSINSLGNNRDISQVVTEAEKSMTSEQIEQVIAENKDKGLSEKQTLQTLSSEAVYDVEDSGQPRTYDRDEYAKQVMKNFDEYYNTYYGNKEDSTNQSSQPKAADINIDDLSRFGDSEYDQMCLMMTATFMATPSNDDEEAYAHFVYDPTTKEGTLTFYYDDQKTTHTDGYLFPLNTGTATPDWRGVGDTGLDYNCHNVVFDSSFAMYRPTTCNAWFKSFTDTGTFTKFRGMENLMTGDCTNFTSMFDGCAFANTNPSTLDIDFNNLDTTNGQKMSCMFANCPNLDSLDLSKISRFTTNQATLIGGMFSGSPLITKVDANYISLTNLAYNKSAYYAGANRLFQNCSYIQEIDFANWDTNNLKNGKKFIAMLDGCVGLNKIVVSAYTWNLPFYCGTGGCYLNNNQKTEFIEADLGYYIKDSEGWYDFVVVGDDEETTTLKPETFSEYGVDQIEITSTNDDELDPQRYASLASGVLTYHYDNTLYSYKGTLIKDFVVKNYESDYQDLVPTWTLYPDLFNTVTDIRCDNAYAQQALTEFHPNKVDHFCAGMQSLQTADLSFIDFSSCEYFKEMFCECPNLQNVTFIRVVEPEVGPDPNSNSFESGISFLGMFAGCYKLQNVNFPNRIAYSDEEDPFSIDFSYMFYECKELKSFAIQSPLKTHDPKLRSMFEKCYAAENIDLSQVDIVYVNDVDNVNIASCFKSCTSLQQLNLPLNFLLCWKGHAKTKSPTSASSVPKYIESYAKFIVKFSPFYGAVIDGDFEFPISYEYSGETQIPYYTETIDSLFAGLTVKGKLDISNILTDNCEKVQAAFMNSNINEFELDECAFSETSRCDLMFYGFENHSEEPFDFSQFKLEFGPSTTAAAMFSSMKVDHVVLPEWYFAFENIFVPGLVPRDGVDETQDFDENDVDTLSNETANPYSKDNDEPIKADFDDKRKSEHQYPFADNKYIYSVDISKALPHYEDYQIKNSPFANMFKNCTNLEHVYAANVATFSDDIQSMSYDVFTGCEKLTGYDGTTIYNASERGISAYDLSGFQIGAYDDGGSAGFLSPRQDTVLVKFQYNNPEGITVYNWGIKDRQFVVKGSDIHVPMLEPMYYSGMHFITWFTTPTFKEGTEVPAGSTLENVQEPTTLYASTKTNETRTITFHEGLVDGDCQQTIPEPLKVNVIDTGEEYIDIPTPILQVAEACLSSRSEGKGNIYNFVSWNTRIDGKGEDYAYNEKGFPPIISTTEDVHLYAQYEAVWSVKTSFKDPSYQYGFAWNTTLKCFAPENSYKGLSSARQYLRFEYVGQHKKDELLDSIVIRTEGAFSGLLNYGKVTIVPSNNLKYGWYTGDPENPISWYTYTLGTSTDPTISWEQQYVSPKDSIIISPYADSSCVFTVDMLYNKGSEQIFSPDALYVWYQTAQQYLLEHDYNYLVK